jgi:O-methyltransferase
MKSIQAFNFLAGKFFNNQKSYINFSLLYLKRKRAIDRNYMDYIRISTLELAAHEIKERNVEGAVAEVGVYKGKFARYINQFFPDRKLYLFDTFKGFDASDVKTEVANNLSAGDQDFSNTSVKAVLSLMPHPEKCIVREGFFPETTKGLEEEFAFVSLDTDLFDPIYNGLVYFYPRLKKGGYIFVHDYNNDNYSGAKKAVRKYCEENNLPFVPIPDSTGSAIICK